MAIWEVVTTIPIPMLKKMCQLKGKSGISTVLVLRLLARIVTSAFNIQNNEF